MCFAGVILDVLSCECPSYQAWRLRMGVEVLELWSVPARSLQRDYLEEGSIYRGDSLRQNINSRRRDFCVY